jgi:signal transduction histidine kinase
MAKERSLSLECEGPDSLPVESDLVKLQRIVQNLLLNALKATQRGGVVVRWSVQSTGDSRRWRLSVEDTGPGFTLQSEGPLRHALKSATDEARRAEAAGSAHDTHAPEAQRSAPPAAGSGPGSAVLPSGEGIGLSIVKRLCELLSATLELETAPGRGTTIRIDFPLRYAAEDASSSGRGERGIR